jgi:hypothetical protein
MHISPSRRSCNWTVMTALLQCQRTFISLNQSITFCATCAWRLSDPLALSNPKLNSGISNAPSPQMHVRHSCRISSFCSDACACRSVTHPHISPGSRSISPRLNAHVKTGYESSLVPGGLVDQGKADGYLMIGSSKPLWRLRLLLMSSCHS